MIPTSLLLIDDDELCIMLSEIAIKSTGMVDELQIFNNGEDALAHLEKSAAGSAWPDVILLDLNMPIMDGWDFLELYDKMNLCASKSHLYIVSSTISDFEINRAKKYPCVLEFLPKPLSQDRLTDIITKSKAGLQ